VEELGVGATLNRLTVDEVQAMRSAALRAARTLNADVEMQKILDLYAGLFDNRQLSRQALLSS